MAFLLRTGDDREIRDPSPEAIAALIQAVPGGDDSFLVLAPEQDELTYIQAIGSPAEGFAVEYQEGALDQHFECAIQPLPTEHVVLAFQAYLRGDDVWKTALTWRRMQL